MMLTDKAWLEDRLQAHRRWQRLLLWSWAASIIGITGLFGVALPLMRTWLRLPDEVMWVTVGGVGVELLLLLYLTVRVVKERRTIEAALRQSNNL